MNSFLKQVLATVVGLILVCIVFTIISIVTFAGMIASSGATTSIDENSVLRIKLQGTIEERAGEENPLAMLTGDEVTTIGLDQAMEAISKAAKNDKIQGIYLEGGVLAATPAMMEELRHALLEFKKSGKWIMAYGDTYTKGAYYLCSTADTIMLNPIGMLDWSGMASEPIFFKETLEKIGVRMQVFKVGTFKSAVEPFTQTQMSEPNRLQVTSYLGSIWNTMLQDVAASRKFKVEQLNSMADTMTVFTDPADALKAGMVDKLCYISDVRDVLRNKLNLDDDDDINFVSIQDVANSETLAEKEDNEIAVYYAYGEIVDIAPSGIQDEHQIVGKTVVSDLKELREDDDVKAVVLRVNSPGGSAYASEQIWHEITLLAEKKPVVVSMGGMAASGGYYISCGASKIFAEKSTLTGSIGIFGMIPDASELLTDKLGLHFDCVKTNQLSDFGATGRPFNQQESALVQAHVEKGYRLFLSRVALGRKMKTAQVDSIGQGRVWTGEQAVKIGLVDKIGDLNDAIKAAAKLAKTDKYSVGRYPASESWFEAMFNDHKSSYLESQMKDMLGTNYDALRLLRSLQGQSAIQARIPFDPNIR